jgi:hypothetical protein
MKCPQGTDWKYGLWVKVLVRKDGLEYVCQQKMPHLWKCGKCKAGTIRPFLRDKCKVCKAVVIELQKKKIGEEVLLTRRINDTHR